MYRDFFLPLGKYCNISGKHLLSHLLLITISKYTVHTSFVLTFFKQNISYLLHDFHTKKKRERENTVLWKIYNFPVYVNCFFMTLVMTVTTV